MTGKTKFIATIATVSGFGLGLGFILSAPKDAARSSTTNPPVEGKNSASETQQAPSPTAPIKTQRPSGTKSSKSGPDDVMDPQEWVENGPKEPLVPPEINVEAEPVPGSVVTDEPLHPPEIQVDAELAPGESAPTAPLHPPEIHSDEPAP